MNRISLEQAPIRVAEVAREAMVIEMIETNYPLPLSFLLLLVSKIKANSLFNAISLEQAPIRVAEVSREAIVLAVADRIRVNIEAPDTNPIFRQEVG
jgi:hypothetical protein